MDLRGIEAAMYLRKSRADADGICVDEILRRHRETLTEYASRTGIHIVEAYQEVRSGESLAARPEMYRLLQDVTDGKYNAVLCMDLDRLSRGGTADRGIILEAFQESGTLIVTPQKIYDLREDADGLLAEFMTLFANFELRQTKKRYSRGKLRAAREGCCLSHAPYGYRGIRVNRKPTLEIYEPEAQYVRMMFEWYASGIGCTVIATRLNAIGARPHRAAEFKRVSVIKIIRNPVYVGKIQWNRTKWRYKNGKLIIKPVPKEEWVTVDGMHPAIIDQETFDKCQDILAGRYKPPTNDGSVKSPLVGLLKCQKCGGNMQRAPRRGVDYVRCLKAGCCPGSRQDYVEAAILRELKGELDSLLMCRDDAKESLSTLEAEKKRIANAIAREEKKKDTLRDLLEDGTYTRAVYQERMKLLLDKIGEMDRELKEVEAKIAAAKAADRQAQANQIRSVLDNYPQANAAEKNALLRAVLSKVWYSKNPGDAPSVFTIRLVLKF